MFDKAKSLFDFQSFNINRKLYIFLAVMVILYICGGFLRLNNLASRGIEYDEFFSFSYFARKSVGDIFSNLDTPNNQPLHSLMMKCSVRLFSYKPLSIRLPAFIAGILLLFSVPACTYLLTKKPVAVIFTTAIVAFNAGLIHFSQSARGYSMQCLFISLFILTILVIEQINLKHTVLAYLLWIFPVLSILTLSTSVIFIFPVCLCHMFFLIRQAIQNREEKGGGLVKCFIYFNYPILISYFVLTLFVAWWYISNLDALRAGQIYGEKISSFADWGIFLFNRCFRLASPFLWGFAMLLCFSRKWRFIYFSFIFIVFFPMLMSPLTLAGPPRVYLPTLCLLSVFAALSGACFLDYLKSTMPIKFCAIGFVCLFLFFSLFSELKTWQPIDWKKIFPSISSSFDKNTYICYPAASGLPIFANIGGKSILDNSSRLPRGDKCFFLLVGDVVSDGKVSFELPKSQEVLSPMESGFSFHLFKLKNILLMKKNNSVPHRFLFISIPYCEISHAKQLKRAVVNSIPSEKTICNPWLTRSLFTQKTQKEHIGYFMVFKVSEGFNLSSVEDAMAKLKGKIALYTLDSSSNEHLEAD